MKNIQDYIVEAQNSAEAKKIAAKFKKDSAHTKVFDDIINQIFAAEDEREYPSLDDYKDEIDPAWRGLFQDLFDETDSGQWGELSELGQEVADELGL